MNKKIALRAAIKLVYLVGLVLFATVCSAIISYSSAMLFFFVESKYTHEVLFGIFLCTFVLLYLVCLKGNQHAADSFADDLRL